MKAIPRLFHKPLLFMILVFAVVSVVIGYTSSTTLNRELRAQYREKAEALATSMAASDFGVILGSSAEDVHSNINHYRDILGVHYVVVVNGTNDVVAHTFSASIPDFVQEQLTLAALAKGKSYTFENGNSEILHVTRPVLNGLAGAVHVGMDLSSIQYQIGKAMLVQFGLTFLVFIISVFMAHIFFSKLSEPLAQLTDYARRVASHDFSHDIQVHSKDEIGALGAAMRSMAKEISDFVLTLEAGVHEKTLQLQEAKQDLEQKVVERTAELTRANVQLKIEVAERRVIGEALRKAEQKYRTIFENAVEGIYQMTPSGRYISANPALARVLGYRSSEELMSSVYDSRTQVYIDGSRRSEFLNQLLNHGAVKDFESQARRKDGKIIWVSESARRVDDEQGTPLYFEGSVEDVTLRKKAEQQLKRQAFHDPLTELPNRALFHDHLLMAMERGRRSKASFAVLYLDLDRFKVINDSLGHDIGDELLKAVAKVLKDCARSIDTVARFGGDEFAILLEDLQSPKDVTRVARRILHGVRQPFQLRGNEVFTSASIGIVLHTHKYDRPEMLLRDADTAMYHAKEQGRSRLKVFNQKMHDNVMRLMEMENDLRRALDLDELTVAYQPIVHLPSRQIVGFEALARWEHPERGTISPEEFIPLAEDTGLIYPVDYQIMKKACAQIRRWQQAYPSNGHANLTLNVNISGRHFRRAQLLRQMGELILDSGMEPSCVNIELTESALVEYPAMAEDLLIELKQCGVNICIDDFGTGYSSLSYLQKFPIDVVKVDRTFVTQVQSDSDSRAIVSTIFNLGDSMNLKVVAEGVETQGQLDFLEEVGCHYVQGFLFYGPMSVEEVESMLSKAPLAAALS